MPDQDQLNDFLEALEEVGSPAKNPVLREALGWEEPLYEEVKAELVAKAALTLSFGPASARLLATRPEDKTVVTGALKSNGRKYLENGY